MKEAFYVTPTPLDGDVGASFTGTMVVEEVGGLEVVVVILTGTGGVELELVLGRHWEYHGFWKTQVLLVVQTVPPV